MLAACFCFVSFLYATVGQAGGTAFLALMTFASFAPSEMRPTALLLNIIAATYSTWLFSKGSFVDWVKLRPYLIASLPTAFAGGFIVLNERLYNTVTGSVLLIAAIALVYRQYKPVGRERTQTSFAATFIGAIVGFISGVTGVGGGVFLAPFLIVGGYAKPKETAALSSPFILANSSVGLIGTFFAGQLPSPMTGLFAIAALLGAIIGTNVGLKWLSPSMTRIVLASILLVASLQLLFTT